MARRGAQRCFFLSWTLAAISVLICIVHVSRISWTHHRFYEACGEECIKVDNSSHYLIQTEGCDILDFDLSHPDIAKYTYKNVKELVCSKHLPLTEESGLTLIFYKERIPLYGSSKSSLNCSYQGIFRNKQHPNRYTRLCDKKYTLMPKVPLVQRNTVIREDGILVTCHDFSISRRSIYRSVHFFIQPRRAYKKRKQFKSEVGERGERPETLSVIIMGTDAVSRASFRRHMIKTFDYLTDHLQAIDLQGLNKVDDNTYPNVVALLMGLSLEEIQKHECRIRKRYSKFDHCPLIWKEYAQKGYVTAYGEDTPNVGSFHHKMVGFVEEPTDYYNRAYFRASDRFTGHNGGIKGSVGFMCQAGRKSNTVIHNYSLTIAEELKDVPYFGYYWTTSVTHDSLEGAVRADEPSLEYLKKLHDRGYLNHTVLFFISDHGRRSGDFRMTYAGMLEERLPYAYLVFPRWFKEQYPEAVNNLMINTKRMTSTYDLYATLYEMLNQSFTDLNMSSVTFKHGQSLFREIPNNRTCEDAGVPEHYCACELTTAIDPHDPNLLEAAEEAVTEINWGLEAFPKCAHLSLHKVLSGRVGSARKSSEPEQSETVLRSYIITFITEPGGGVLEATVRHQAGEYHLASEVSRINIYGNQSHCIDDNIYRKYCYCKDLL